MTSAHPEHEADRDEKPKGSRSEPTANPTPPEADPTTTPDVRGTPQTPPDHRK